jgi:RNA polymerase-binding protein DksA
MQQAIIEQLRDKKVSLAQRIAAIESDLTSARSADFAEQTTERENDEVLEAILVEAKQELNQIEQALQRVKAGTYGICEQCEQPIDLKRLQALPYTTRCINCAV